MGKEVPPSGMSSVWCGACSLAACVRVEISGMVPCGSRGFACVVPNVYGIHLTPALTPRHIMVTFSFSFWGATQFSLPTEFEKRSKNKSDPTTNMVPIPPKWGPLSLEALSKMLEEVPADWGVESLLPEGHGGREGQWMCSDELGLADFHVDLGVADAFR